ncbi:MAG: hypothetical protein LRY63_10215 [Nitrincola sp.]|nr:hypothetical protein [Nitrincola sp.]
MLILKKEEAAERLESYTEQETTLQADLEANSEALNNTLQDLANARAELNNTDSAHKVNALESRIAARQHEVSVVREKIQQVYNLMRTTVGFSEQLELLPENFRPVVQQSVQLWRSGENTLSGMWPESPVEVDNTLTKLKEMVDLFAKRLRVATKNRLFASMKSVPKYKIKKVQLSSCNRVVLLFAMRHVS